MTGYSGRWSPKISRTADRAQRLRHARRMEAREDAVDDMAWREAEDAEDGLDVDRLDFDADGRL